LLVGTCYKNVKRVRLTVCRNIHVLRQVVYDQKTTERHMRTHKHWLLIRQLDGRFQQQISPTPQTGKRYRHTEVLNLMILMHCVLKLTMSYRPDHVLAYIRFSRPHAAQKDNFRSRPHNRQLLLLLSWQARQEILIWRGRCPKEMRNSTRFT